MSPLPRGKLKIYMGYAAGVGKTYSMLEEAQNLKSRGLDVVVGYFEAHGRKDTITKAEGLEMIPRKRVEYRGSSFEEMDTGAILARRPRVCAVDEFPHTNVPGSERVKRWEDVLVLLEAGIDVLTTMNIQHLESLNDQVNDITGIRVRETIPDWVVEQADEVVMVDLPPRALLNRLDRGVVYGREKAQRALDNFFRESTLVALRELALRQTAHEVEHRAVGEEAGAHSGGGPEVPEISRGKILVLITPEPETAMLIRRARRVGDFVGAETVAIAVQPSGDLRHLPDADREAFERHLNFARNLRIETRVIAGESVAETVVDFARRNRVTQIFLARPTERRWHLPLSRDLPRSIVALARDIQIVIVSPREPAARR
jgi:two-component system, OmpR family, sensor histidine kinase KdpD